jgi:hypothetical protein
MRLILRFLEVAVLMVQFTMLPVLNFLLNLAKEKGLKTIAFPLISDS